MCSLTGAINQTRWCMPPFQTRRALQFVSSLRASLQPPCLPPQAALIHTQWTWIHLPSIFLVSEETFIQGRAGKYFVGDLLCLGTVPTRAGGRRNAKQCLHGLTTSRILRSSKTSCFPSLPRFPGLQKRPVIPSRQ